MLRVCTVIFLKMLITLCYSFITLQHRLSSSLSLILPIPLSFSFFYFLWFNFFGSLRRCLCFNIRAHSPVSSQHQATVLANHYLHIQSSLLCRMWRSCPLAAFPHLQSLQIRGESPPLPQHKLMSILNGGSSSGGLNELIDQCLHCVADWWLRSSVTSRLN